MKEGVEGGMNGGGVAPSSPPSSGGGPERSPQQVLKERLVAYSCASESLAAIKSLASRDVLPEATVGTLVTALCRLLSKAETGISALLPGGGGGNKDEEADLKIDNPEEFMNHLHTFKKKIKSKSKKQTEHTQMLGRHQ